MPLFEYSCPDGHVMDRFFSSYRVRTETTQCVCGKRATFQISAPNVHTIATFSKDIEDETVRRTMKCDGSYLDPTLSFDVDTGKATHPITSEKVREKRMAELGLFEKPMSDKAKDVARLKKTRPIHLLPSAKSATA